MLKHTKLPRHILKKKRRECLEEYQEKKQLAMVIDTKLIRYQYNIIRSKNKSRFPSYKIIQKTKADCEYYISNEHIVTSSFAEIKFQVLFNYTIIQLLFLQRDLPKTLNLENLQLQMISK